MTIQWNHGGLVDVGVLPDNKLLIVLTSEGWAEQKYIKSQSDKHGINQALNDLFEYLLCNGWDFDTIDYWGNLSSAPGLTDTLEYGIDWEDKQVDHFWYNPQYCIQDEIEEIYAKGYLVWDYWSMI